MSNNLEISDSAIAVGETPQERGGKWASLVRASVVGSDKRTAAGQSATILLAKIDIARGRLEKYMQAAVSPTILEKLKGQYEALGLRTKMLISSLQFPNVKIPPATLAHDEDEHHEEDLSHHLHGEDFHDCGHLLHENVQLLHEIDSHFVKTSHERDAFANSHVSMGAHGPSREMPGFEQPFARA